MSHPHLGRLLAALWQAKPGCFSHLPYLYTTNWITQLTDGEDHERMTSTLTDCGNCMGFIEGEQDSGSEACVTSLDNGTEPSASGSNLACPPAS